MRRASTGVGVLATGTIVVALVGVGIASAASVGVSSQYLGTFSAPVTVTPPPPSTCTLRATADTYVGSGLLAGLNFDANKYLRVGPRLSVPVGDNRVLVRFDLTGACAESASPIPSGSTAISGTLELFIETAPSDNRTDQLRRVTSAWSESKVVWNTQPSVGGVQTSALSGTTANVWRPWTVTGDVRGFLAGSLVNNGWRIDDAKEGAILSGLSAVDYCGRSGGATATCVTSGVNDRRPRLTITYQAP